MWPVTSMKRVDLKREDGFTLIELMITVLVVVLALVGYVGANIAIQQTGEGTFERSVAMQDANQVIERIRNTAASGQFPDDVTASFPNGDTVDGFDTLTNEQVTVSYADPDADPLDVTVNVSWLGNGRRPVSAALRTYVTQRSTQ